MGTVDFLPHVLLLIDNKYADDDELLWELLISYPMCSC